MGIGLKAMVYSSVHPHAGLHGECVGVCAFLLRKAFAAKYFRIGAALRDLCGTCLEARAFFVSSCTVSRPSNHCFVKGVKLAGLKK